MAHTGRRQASTRSSKTQGKLHAAIRQDTDLRAREPEPEGLSNPLLIKLLRRLFVPAAIGMLSAVLNGALWVRLSESVKPRAWDGTGHFALAQLYDQSIFPSTFGWSNAYFGGMPFPNFYPPLFYWCVAFLHHTHLFSFTTAFNFVLALPVLLLPVVIWMLARAVSANDRAIATCAALVSIPLLTDIRFEQYGLSYPSTFLIGLYTQPLGFVLLILWYIVYVSSPGRFWGVALASLLLALTVLANFFNAVTCAFFIAATILSDIGQVFRWFPGESSEARRNLAAHIISPLVAFCLTLFWLAPVLSAYEYLVTRPQVLPVAQIFSAPSLIWYLLSIIGIVRWARRPSTAMRPFLLGCLGLSCAVLFASLFSPRWFPFQAPRFVATLNFLFAVPVGYAIAGLFRNPDEWLGKAGLWTRLKIWLLKKTRVAEKRKRVFRAWLRDWLLGKASVAPSFARFVSPFRLKVASALLLLILSFLLLDRPSYDLAFYTANSQQQLQDILGFAEEHREGRYSVEVPVASSNEAAFDGRALNSYLGAQGNETLSVVFREASPNSIFFNAAVNALSAYPDTFGISSVLAEDLDFRDQPLAKHLERARLLGTKYLVIFTSWMKQHLAEEKGVKPVFKSGDWTVFELTEERLARVRALQFKPALVLSNFSLKQRRQNEYDFVRLAEEQFTDGWFDVLLARSPEPKVDQIQDLDQFGALILDTYKCENENAAFEQLQSFAQDHLLVLLSSDASLFRRIRSSIADFPFARIVQRPLEEPGEWLDALTPTRHYEASAIRTTWRAIRDALDSHKQATGAWGLAVDGEIGQNAIQVNVKSSPNADRFPMLIDTTYFPAWRRDDGQRVYAATPFYMVTFVSGPARIVYGRRLIDLVALFVSGTAFLALCGFVGFHYRKRLIQFAKAKLVGRG